jgi:RimJ/RimL family protein N-acetyltransferase
VVDDSDIEADPLLIEAPETLSGTRIFLRPLTPGEGDMLFAAIEESRALLSPWQTWPSWHETPRHSELAIRRMRIAFARRETLAYGVFQTSDHRFLGRVQLEEIDWRARRFGLGYWLRESATRRGFATEAARVLIDLAFEKFEALRLEILVDSANEPSAAVARRLGFKCEGRLRNERVNSLGQPQDTLVFGFTRDDRAKHATGRGGLQLDDNP